LDASPEAPRTRRSNWAKQPRNAGSYWSRSIRERIAFQVERIRHWTIKYDSWENAPDVEAHWFIDPPYQQAGRSYRFHEVDYRALAQWAQNRKGFVQVCESDAADWLPFEPHALTRRYRQGGTRRSVEALFEKKAFDAGDQQGVCAT
jgi:hypothetical protein